MNIILQFFKTDSLMKKVLIIIFTLCSTLLHATTFFIDPSGKDTNDGSNSSPWKTLAYACTRATTSGDIIHVNAGTYIEYYQSNLAKGVSIEGEGITSVILSNVTKEYFATITLTSTSEGTSGNQHISYIKMDGNNLAAYSAIEVAARSNVTIHHCTFTDFNCYGIVFNGAEGYGQPSTYAKGNKFYNNTVINCARFYSPPADPSGDGKWLIGLNGQDGMLIYDNYLNQTARAPGYNGYCIKGIGGFNRGCKIYNNTVIKAPYDGLTWDFAIEFWDCRGGIEIYNNTITAGIDISGYDTKKGSYEYSVYIHDNIIGPTSLSKYEAVRAILIEGNITDLIIERNYIKNVSTGIFFAQYPSSRTVNNVYIIYNVIDNIGVSDDGLSSKGWGTFWSPASNDNFADNINICNNVFIGHEGAKTNMWGIQVPNIGTATNVTIRNNIIRNFDFAPTYGWNNLGGETLDGLSIENNIFYNCGFSNQPRYDNTFIPKNNVTQNNITSDPLFVSSSDFHLQGGSPAIYKGIKISNVITDFDGNTIKDPQSIGAYEYNSAPQTPIIPVYSSSVIENSTPDLLEMTFNVSLTDSIPNASAFTILVDGINRALTSVSILGNKVRLKLADPVEYNNAIFITYTPPSKQPIQTPSRGLAAAITSQPVTNNLLNPANNSPPEVVINYPSTGFSGFVYKLDASGTTDLNNDALTFSWTAPAGIPVSSTDSSIIRFLAPIVINQSIITFSLDVSDGKAQTSKNLSITINPYKPELGIAKNKIIEASNYNLTDYPQNVDDGNLTTKWSVNGDNQWLLFSLAEPFKISYLQIALLPDQKYESYFDLYASRDNLTWEPVLIKTASCNFSGSLQNFDFPAIKTNIEYSFVKLVGHGNSLNAWNNISEIKLFGDAGGNTTNTNFSISNITIYPNPASYLINVLILEPPAEPQLFRIYDMIGTMRFESHLDPGVNNVQIPINLNSGIYIAEVMLGKLIMFAQKLLIIK